MFSKVFWQSIDYPSLQIEEWDGEFTVFQPNSGKTHFLNRMGLQIVLDLGQSPASEEEICTALAKTFQQALDKNFCSQINKTLHRFEDLGLVEKV